MPHPDMTRPPPITPQWGVSTHPLPPLRLLLLLLLLPLLPLCHAQSSTSSTSFLEWQFCHFARGVDYGWNVTTTGFFVTTPLYSDPTQSTQVAYYTILSIAGTRIQSYYGNTSSALITGIVAPGGWLYNDNVIQTYYPTLSVAGLSYQLDRNVTQIGDTTLYDEINLYQYASGPMENYIDSSIVGLSYFVYSAGNTDQPLQCPPLAPVIYRFAYYAAPRTFADGLSSSCATGTFSLLGPYSFIDFVTQQQLESYIVSDSTGSRVFVNASVVQNVSFHGVTESFGSDFTYYSTYPYADEAGITLITTATPLLQKSAAVNVTANQWLSISSQDHVGMVEQAYQGDALQMDISVTPLSSAPTPPLVCTAAVQAIKWDFCFISTGADAAGRWVVMMNGSLLTTASLNHTHPSYLVTASQGQRTQLTPDGTVHLTNISGVQSLNGYASNPNDNRLYPTHPTLSDAGLTLQFDGGAVVTLPYDYATGALRIPPVWFTTIHGSPAGERYVDQGLVDWSTFFYQRAVDQWNLPLPSTLLCALPAQYQAELNTAQWSNVSTSTQSLLATTPVTVTLPFYYSATPAPRSAQDGSYGSEWSVCATGTFEAVGPLSLDGEVAYQVLSVSGQRLFLDQRGVSSVSAFTSVTTEGGANQLLYASHPYVDLAGISLVLSPFPLFANAADNALFNYIHLANGSGETTGTYTPTSAVTFHFSTDSTTSYSCVQPGDHLGSTQTGGMVVLGVAVVLFGGCTAISTIEQIYVTFRRRRPFALLGWLGLSTLAIGVPVWAGIITYYVSINVECADCLSPLTTSYSFDHLLLSLLPSIVGVFVSVCVMLRSLREYEVKRLWVLRQQRLQGTGKGPLTSKVPSDRSRVQPSASFPTQGGGDREGSISGFYSRTSPSSVQPFLQREPRKRFSLERFLQRQRDKAVSSVQQLRDSHPRHVFSAALSLAAALVLTRWSLSYMALDQADTTSSIIVDVFASLLVYALCYLSLLLYFYTPHFRWLSAVALTAAVVIDCQAHFASDIIRYTPDKVWRVSNPSAGGSGLYRTQLEFATVIALTAAVGGVCLIALVCMLIYRIRASRRLLAATVRKTTTKLNSAQMLIQGQKVRIKKLEVVGVEAVKAMDAIALLRPTVHGTTSKGEDEQRNAARLMLWTYLGHSSSSSLYHSALQRSAALVAPLLFARRSSVVAMPSASRALSPSATGTGSTIINMKGSTTRASLTGQSLGAGWTTADAVNGTKKNSLVDADTTATSTAVTTSIPNASSPTPTNGVEVLLKATSFQHRSSGADSTLAPEEAVEPSPVTAAAALDPTITSSLQLLGGHLLVREQREEELLHQQMTALQKPGSDAQALCCPLQLIADEGRSREMTAILTRLTAATTTYRPTLHHVLSHPVCAEVLKDHTQAAASVENILFLLAVARWKLVRSQPLRHSLAVLIYDEFIAGGSQHEVNIEATQRAGLCISIAAGKGGKAKLSDALFAKVEKEVCMLVETNNWKTFVRSPVYELCTTVLVRNAVVMTAMQLEAGEEEAHETAIFSLNTHEDGSSDGDEEELPGQVADAPVMRKGRTDSIEMMGGGGMQERSVSEAKPPVNSSPGRVVGSTSPILLVAAAAMADPISSAV